MIYKWWYQFMLLWEESALFLPRFGIARLFTFYQAIGYKMLNFNEFFRLFTRLSIFFMGLRATCDSFPVKCFFMTFGNYLLGLFVLLPVEMAEMLIYFAYKYNNLLQISTHGLPNYSYYGVVKVIWYF